MSVYSANWKGQKCAIRSQASRSDQRRALNTAHNATQSDVPGSDASQITCQHLNSIYVRRVISADGRDPLRVGSMNFKFRFLPYLLYMFAALVALAPVCVLAGGDTKTLPQQTVELSDGALLEVLGENAEVRVRGVATRTLEIDVTMNNGEFVDFYTQTLYGSPASHFVISAMVSEGGATSANSLIEIGIPAGVKLVVRTKNGSISVDGVSVESALLSTSDGTIKVKNSSGKFDLNTTNSEVTVQAVDGPVNVVTTNAHVWFEGVIDQGSNSISTSNGDIAVRLKKGSNVFVTGTTKNGDVTVDGADDYDGLEKQGDTASISFRVDIGVSTLHLTNGPGAIHINPDIIAVFDEDG